MTFIILLLVISYSVMTEGMSRLNSSPRFRDYLRYQRDGVIVGAHELPHNTVAKVGSTLRRMRPRNIVERARLRRTGRYRPGFQLDTNRNMIAKSHKLYRAHGGGSLRPVYVPEDHYDEGSRLDDEDYDDLIDDIDEDIDDELEYEPVKETSYIRPDSQRRRRLPLGRI